MNTQLDRINVFSSATELSSSRGKCPIDKLFMMERCNYGDLLEVKLPSVNDDFIVEQDLIWLLKVKVTVLAARPDYNKNDWLWEPKEYRSGTIAFYHHDAEVMLEEAASWLEAHRDPIAPVVTNSRYGDYTITPLKCEPIGRILHYTTTPGFEDGNLERKRGW